MELLRIPWCTTLMYETGGPVTNITQHKGYATIQAAIDDANAMTPSRSRLARMQKMWM